MEHSVGKTLLIGILLNLWCHCKGLDFCTANTNQTTGSLMSLNYQDFGMQFRCECRLTNPVSHPNTLVSSRINFQVEDNNHNQCNQRMVINRGNVNFNVCPRDEYVQHTLDFELGAGEHIFIYTLGTVGDRWKVKYDFQSTQFLDVQCKVISNDTGMNPPCTCAHSRGGGGAYVPGSATANDLGTRLGIGFGCVLGFLVIVAIIALVYFMLKKRKRQRSEEHHDMGKAQAPPLEHKEPPVIHDPRYGIAYPEYAEAGDPRINTNLAYTPDNPHPFKKSSDSGLQDMHYSQERLDQPPSYNNHYIPPQPNAAAPGADPSVLYARPNAKPAQQDRRSLTGMGAITGSNDGLYPYADNETYMTDSQTNSHNTSKDFTQTEV